MSMDADETPEVMSRVLHAAVTVSSRERADELFGELLGMDIVKEFAIGPGRQIHREALQAGQGLRTGPIRSSVYGEPLAMHHGQLVAAVQAAIDGGVGHDKDR